MVLSQIDFEFIFRPPDIEIEGTKTKSRKNNSSTLGVIEVERGPSGAPV
jgi:hypothetical protein